VPEVSIRNLLCPAVSAISAVPDDPRDSDGGGALPSPPGHKNPHTGAKRSMRPLIVVTGSPSDLCSSTHPIRSSSESRMPFWRKEVVSGEERGGVGGALR